MSTSISVIIPTYNRAATLRRTLEGYARQSGDHQLLEVLVVDDGSEDDTEEVVRQFGRESGLPLRYLKQENLGLSAARNHALREARGSLILLGDDDIIPSAKMMAEHVAWHIKYPQPEVGVLGFVTWAQELNPTPFMVWSGLYGPQFSFGTFTPGMVLDFRYGYFCNTSLKRCFVKENGFFSETFRQYGWEDLEFSYRLCQKGYRLLYNPAAIGYHYKYEKFENTRRRVEKLYQSWPEFAKTDAGQRFLQLWRAQKNTNGESKGLFRALLRPLKSATLPLFRPLMDSQIPLPGWLYDRIFYHYVTPFSKYVTGGNEPRVACEGANR
jgi:glycosyltransferase involved in cell wall biosynthesis